MKLSIDTDKITGDVSNHELARLAAIYAMPPHLREHDTGGDQLPRQFPREHLAVVTDDKTEIVSDAVSHSKATEQKTKKMGLHGKFWKPMEGAFTPEKRITEIDTAITLLEMEKERLSK